MNNEIINESITTTIGGIEVELELYEEDGEQRSSCFLSYQCGRKDWSASLEAALANGSLDPNHSGEDGDEKEYAVSRGTLNRIETWAIDNGY